MKIKTAKLGEIEIDENNIISFNPGLLAFEDLSSYALLDINETPDFKWLQSLQNHDLAFLLVDPFTIKGDYTVELNDDIVAKLEIAVPEDVLVYSIVTVPASGLKNATTNLVGPLVINWTRKKAQQVIFEKENEFIRYPLLAAQ